MADVDSRSGSRYAGPEVLEWTAGVHAPHDDALERAYRAPEREGLPAIQIGPSEGRALELLLRLAGARRVVEIGTLAGYSALWMARAVGPEGRVWTIEADPKTAAVARGNLAASPTGDRVTLVEGTALEVLSTLEPEGPFDAVFVDADKRNYPHYGAWAAANLRAGALLLGDNAYLFGRLLAEEDDAVAMRRFHEESAGAFDSVCLPTPDGMLVGIRRPS
ncbi:MAG: O-methyltransferase [Myxococcota bacterium]